MPETHNLPKPPSLWRSIGPSFILLGLALGSGELILWPYLAANWGLGLIWGALLGITFQYLLNLEVMRYSLAWGESVFVGLRKIGKFLPAWFILSTFIPWSLPGFSSASSQIIAAITPFNNLKILSIVLLVTTGLILTIGKTLYRTMEIFQKAIILLGLPFIVILVFLVSKSADWVELAQGLVGKGSGWWFFPPGVAFASFLGAFAYSGAGGNLNLAQSYYIKEKGFGMGSFTGKITSLFAPGKKVVELEGQTFTDSPENRRLWGHWWRLVSVEHFLVFWGLGFLTIVLLAVLSRSLVFGQASQSGIAFLFQEGAALSQILHPFIGTFFLIVSAVMLFSTQVGVLESSSRIISENVLLLIHKPGQKTNPSLAFYLALWSQIVFGIVTLLLGYQEPRTLLTLSAVLNGAAMMVAFPLVYWLNKRKLNKELQPALWRKIGLAVAFAFFVYFVILIVKDSSL